MTDLQRLSEIIKESKKPASYYRAFLQAAQQQQISGVIVLAERIKLPPAKKGGKVREVSDYAILPSEEFNDWHSRTLTAENTTARVAGGVVAPKFADLVAGKIDLDQAQELTRKELELRAERNRKNAERIKQKRQES